MHRLRMNGMKTSCWVVSLERQPPSGPDDMREEEERPYICPFAEDLINVLNPEKTADDPDCGQT